MKQYLSLIGETEKKQGRVFALYQCVCGNVREIRTDSVSTNRVVSCGCLTKDGKRKHGMSGSPEYVQWAVYYSKLWPDFELFFAELGPQPFPEAGIVPLNPDVQVGPNNAGWGYIRQTHGNDRLDRELFMPLNPELFNQYNIDAYQTQQGESSWVDSLGSVTSKYDKLYDKYQDNLEELEKVLEELSVEQALERFDKNEQDTIGKSSGSAIWAQFKAKLLPMVVERMEQIHQYALNGRSGIHHHIIGPVMKSELITSEEIAAITLAMLFDALGDGEGYKTPLVKVYKSIGERIDNQMYFKHWSLWSEQDFDYIKRWHLTDKSKSNYSYKVNKATAWLQDQGDTDVPYYPRISEWVDSKGKDIGEESLIHLGEWAFQAVQSVCLWFEAVYVYPINRSTRGRQPHKQYFLGLSAEGMKWRSIIKLGIQELMYDPMPMCIKPLDWPLNWSEVGGHGGYLKPHPMGCSDLVHNTRGTKPSAEAVQALNNMQSVAWMINPFMFHVMSSLLGTGHIIKKFRTYERELFYDAHWPDIDPAVWNLPKSALEYRKAKRQIARVHALAKEEEKVSMGPYRVLKEAAKFLNYPRFYLPAYFDSRLRCYYLPTLSPQGANHIKSLFLFADPVVISDSNRAAVKRDLLITIANCWGEDKIPLDDRVTFAEALVRDLENVCKEPLSAGHLAAWSGCAEPFTCLAAMREYHEIFTWKTSTTSRIPCGRDASSSGLQILGSMARDEKAMTFTNCLSPERPMDLYGEVARHAKALLMNHSWMKEQLEKRLKNAEAKAKRTKGKVRIPENGFTFDLDIGLVDRTVMKRLVMTENYNASFLSKNSYVSEALMVIAKKTDTAVSLAEKVIVTQAGVDGQAQAFPICQLVKKFFTDVVVNGVGKNGLSYLEWATPNGSIIRQKYNKRTAKQIQTYAMGTTLLYQTKKSNADADGAVLLTIQKSSAEVDPSKHGSALSPNWTHSADAYIAQDILYRFNKPMAVCHDCWYPRASEVDECLTIAKEALLKLAKSDMPQDLLDRNGITGVIFPRLGDDNLLDKIMESDYIFA